MPASAAVPCCSACKSEVIAVMFAGVSALPGIDRSRHELHQVTQCSWVSMLLLTP